MAWVRLDEAFRRHPKIIGLSERAFRLHMYALSYCAENLTDGDLDARALRLLEVEVGWKAKKYVDELVAAKLWHTIAAGFTVNDYLEYNPDAASLKRMREERSAAGKRGAAGRWNGNSDGKGYGKSHSNSQWQEPQQSADAPAVVPLLKFKGSTADSSIEHEIDKLLRCIGKVDEGTRGVLVSFARKLPPSSVAKVRESCQSRKVGAGYAVNALKSELAELEEVTA